MVARNKPMRNEDEGDDDDLGGLTEKQHIALPDDDPRKRRWVARFGTFEFQKGVVYPCNPSHYDSEYAQLQEDFDAEWNKRAAVSKRRSGINIARWATYNYFVDEIIKLVGPQASTIWMILFRFAKPDGSVFASLKTLAEISGLHRRTIQRSIQVLVRFHKLEIVHRGGGASATTYQLRMEGGCQKVPLKGGGRK